MAVMSTSQSATGGVRNLRAIFEHRSSDLSTSPPSRGRSPNGSLTPSHSRPLSKVRTSFVAIERPSEGGGPPQLGLRKALEELDNSAIMDDREASGPGLGAILKGSPFEEAGSAKKGVTPSAKSTKNGIPKANGVAEKAAAVAKEVKDSVVSAVSSIPANKAASTATSTTTQPKPELKTDLPTQAKKSPVVSPNPSFPKPRGGGAKIQAVMESAREAREARAAAAQAKTETALKKDTNKVPTPTSAKAPRASLPARLNRPAGSATAPTASSVAKNDTNQPGEQKLPDRKAVARGPPRVANATTASSLAKKSSRASLGGTEQPKSRPNAPRGPADEGFLARMMRPTASSAQKTHDKVQAESSPPAKTSLGPKPVRKTGSSRKSLASSTTEDAGDQTMVESISEEADQPSPGVAHQAEITNGDSQEPLPPPNAEVEIPTTN